MESSDPTDPQQPTVGDDQVIDLQRAGKLLAGLAELRRNLMFCDVLLQTDSLANESVLQAVNRVVAGEAARETADQTSEVEQIMRQARGVWAHSPVLAAASPNFRTMISENDEERIKRIIIQDVELETIQVVVDYIYSPTSLTVTIENAPMLMAAANSMRVNSMRDAVCEHLMNALAPDNALEIHAFAKRYNCDALAEAVERYIDDNAQQVLTEPAFLELSPDTLAALLDSDRFNAPEELVLDAVIRWTQHHPLEQRKRHLYRLLGNVRLALVPREALNVLVQNDPLATTEPNAILQVFEAIADDRDEPERRKQIAARAFHRPRQQQASQSQNTQRNSIRSQNMLPEVVQRSQSHLALLVAGGRVKEGCSDTVLIYSFSAGRWETVAALPEPRNSVSGVLLGTSVYIIGGDDAVNPTRSVFVYDAFTNSWTTAPEMITARCWQGAAAFDGRLYVMGGWDRATNTNLNLVEALDPREGQWQTIANMQTGRRALGVAAMGGMLYVVGGHDGSSFLKSIERYDPRANTWMSAEPMAEPRGGVGLGVVDDVLYAVGGVARDAIVLQSVERYRVGSGWESAPEMAVPRRGAAVTAHGSCLYAAGGFLDRSVLSNRVSIFDTTTDIWTDSPDLPEGRAGAAAVVVAWPPSTP